MNKTEALEKQVASNYKNAMEAATVAAAYAEENKMLRIWKADALERIANDERAYKEQAEMLVKMHSILNKVADMLFDARRELSSVIELKDEYADTVKRIKRAAKKSNKK